MQIAAELTGARYAALGVIDRDGEELERFITHGVGERGGGGDRRSSARGRDPRSADPRCRDAAPSLARRRPTFGWLPAEPSADAHVPGRSGRAARRRLRQPLPDREGGWRRFRCRRRGPCRSAGGSGGGGDRERAAVRGLPALVATARGVERGRQCARERDRSAAPAGADRAAGYAS